MEPSTLKETRDIIDNKVTNKEQMIVPLEYIYWSDGASDRIPAPVTGLVKQDPGRYLKKLSETYCMEYCLSSIPKPIAAELIDLQRKCTT